MSIDGRSPLPTVPDAHRLMRENTTSFSSSSMTSFRAVPLSHRVGEALVGFHSSSVTTTTTTPMPVAAERAAKWAALGVDVNKLLGTTALPLSTSLRHSQATPHNPTPPPPAAVPSTSTAAHHNLVRLSRSITEARREQLFQPTVSSSGSSKGAGGPRFGTPGFWASKQQQAKKRARETDEQSEEALPATGNSRMREPELPAVHTEESTEDVLATINTHTTSVVTSHAQPAQVAPASVPSQPAATAAAPPPVGSKSKNLPGAPKPRSRKSVQAPSVAAPTTAGRTLFTFANRAGDAAGSGHLTSNSGSGAALIPLASYQEIDNIDALLSEMHEDVADTTRIQAPLVGVALFTTDQHSNYSLSVGQSASNKKANCSLTSAACVANRDKLMATIDRFLIHWRGQVYAVSRESGVALLMALDRRGPLSDVDVVSWHASCLYLPLLAAHASPQARLQFAPPFVLDIRVMCWMLNPAELCADFDAAYAQHLQQHNNNNNNTASSSNAHHRGSQYRMGTMQGTCDRLAQSMALYRRLYAALGSKGLLQPFLKQERQMTMICAQMKFDGFLVDISKVDAFKARAQETLEALHKEAMSMVAPHMTSFNLQSPDDCRQALYGVLNLDGHLLQSNCIAAGGSNASSGTSSGFSSATSGGGDVATTKNGKLSTAEETLKRLAAFHRLPSVILSYRKVTKLLQTYVEGILDNAALLDDQSFFKELGVEDIDAVPIETFLLDGAGVYDSLLRQRREWQSTLRRVHATFLQEGTDTGRLSCVEPNLQNLPRSSSGAEGVQSSVDRGDDNGDHCSSMAQTLLDGAFIRRTFVPLPGCSLVAVDFEQIELRILAHMSNDATLVQSLSTGSDIHRQIASVVFRKPQSAISKEERTLAKRVVFGVLYGMGPRALAAQLGESYEQALHIQNAFKQGFPHVERYAARVVAQCRQDGGVVRTLCGRTRTLTDINDSNLSKRSIAERQAFNTIIQGGAADVVKKSMVAVNDGVLLNPAFGGRVRLHCQVHDELVFSVPHEHLKEAVHHIRQCMTTCMLLAVPLCVSVQVGESYGAMQAYVE